MSLFQGLESSPVFLVCTVAILGLLVGSFLNVVIQRLPRMMEIAWKKECREILELPEEPAERISLIYPP